MSFFSDVVDSVVGGYDNALGHIFDPFSGRSQQEDANKMAMQAWNLSNDYNSPKKQVERLVEAGLNPYLVNLSGNTAGVPGLTGGNVSTGTQSMFSGLNTILGSLQGKATLDSTKAQTQASTAAAGASAAQANNLEAQTSINQKKASYEEQNLIADLDYKRAQTRLAQAQQKKVNAEADIAQGEADVFGAVGGSKGASAVGGALKTGARIVRGLIKK